MAICKGQAGQVEEMSEREAGDWNFSSVVKIVLAIGLFLITNTIMSLFHLLQSGNDNNKFRLHNILFTQFAAIIQVFSVIALTFVIVETLELVDEEMLDSLAALTSFIRFRVQTFSLTTICIASLIERYNPNTYLGKYFPLPGNITPILNAVPLYLNTDMFEA